MGNQAGPGAADKGGADEGQRVLDRAYEGLEAEVPDRVSRAIRWLRDPKARWIRLPVGVLFILASVLWFLPVVGIEMLPIGLLLIAQDVPFLRKPVGRAMIWLEGKWRALRKRWQGRAGPER
ncbi:MAG TPA: hypothetical protein VEY95_09445 [Azospirillaceae bacterium]|nr:hypothetical protein [Azospirillaceae bacterium]